MTISRLARLALGGALITEAGMALHRFEARRRAFDSAARRAALLQRPLIVVGDPDAGAHTRIIRAYGCGDLCVDLTGCPLCPVTRTARSPPDPAEPQPQQAPEDPHGHPEPRPRHRQSGRGEHRPQDAEALVDVPAPQVLLEREATHVGRHGRLGVGGGLEVGGRRLGPTTGEGEGLAETCA